MTILTKSSIALKNIRICRSSLVNLPLVPDEESEKVVVQGVVLPGRPRPGAGARSTGALLCLTIVALLVASAGFLCGLELYRECLKSNSVTRFQGYCSIPVDQKEDEAPLIEPFYRMVPLRWTSEPGDDVQVFSAANEANTDDMLNTLREEFDIGDTVEKISVYNGPNGRQTSFIHDFASNVSGIVDEERCFLMDLDLTQVMPPSVFVMSIESGEPFDVARVRTAMRALLPPLADLVRRSRQLAEKCADRPTYQLEKDAELTVRKRSIAEPVKADYTHFAGKRVQEIDVDNLPELLAYEKKDK